MDIILKKFWKYPYLIILQMKILLLGKQVYLYRLQVTKMRVYTLLLCKRRKFFSSTLCSLPLARVCEAQGAASGYHWYTSLSNTVFIKMDTSKAEDSGLERNILFIQFTCSHLILLRFSGFGWVLRAAEGEIWVDDNQVNFF